MSIFLQVDSLAVANQMLADSEPVEQTLSIWKLLTSGGVGGQAIILVLFMLKFLAVAFYFMELKTANIFWKSAVLIFVSIFLGIILNF